MFYYDFAVRPEIYEAKDQKAARNLKTFTNFDTYRDFMIEHKPNNHFIEVEESEAKSEPVTNIVVAGNQAPEISSYAQEPIKPEITMSPKKKAYIPPTEYRMANKPLMN